MLSCTALRRPKKMVAATDVKNDIDPAVVGRPPCDHETALAGVFAIPLLGLRSLRVEKRLSGQRIRYSVIHCTHV